jgi:hypothetical protein
MLIPMSQPVRWDPRGRKVPGVLQGLEVQGGPEVRKAPVVRPRLYRLESLVLLEGRRARPAPLDLPLHEPRQDRLHRDHRAVLLRLEVLQVLEGRVYQENPAGRPAPRLQVALEGPSRLEAPPDREDLRAPEDQAAQPDPAQALNRPTQGPQAQQSRKG